MVLPFDDRAARRNKPRLAARHLISNTEPSPLDDAMLRLSPAFFSPALFFFGIAVVAAAPRMNPDSIIKTSLHLAEPGALHVDWEAPGIEEPNHGLYVALDTDPAVGSAVVPFQHAAE